MRFNRLKVSNWRGIRDCEITFADQGITALVGDNEVGKSSLIEAVTHLMDFKAPSRSEKVKSVQPVGKDVGPEVELELSFGEHRMVYTKRYVKSPLTELKITGPQPEQLSGDEAHDRAEMVMAEHCDLELWKALRVQQGNSEHQPGLGGVASLSRALEGRAGGSADDGGGFGERLEEAFLAYWTKGGKQSKKVGVVQQEFAAAKAEQEELEQRSRELEESVQKLDDLTVLHAQEKQALPGLQEDADRKAKAVSELEGLEKTLEAAEGRVKLAAAAVADLERQSTERSELRLRIEGIQQEATEAEQALLKQTQDLEELARRRTAAKDALGEAKERASGCRRARSQAIDDVRGLEREQRVPDIERRRQGVQRDLDAWKDVHDKLERIDVPDAAFDSLESALTALQQAEARKQAEGGRVVVKASADVRLKIDGRDIEVAAGSEEQARFASACDVIVPGVVDVTIASGAEGENLQVALDAAEAALNGACADAGVKDVEEARQRRAEAQALRSESRAARDRLVNETESDQDIDDAELLAAARALVAKLVSSEEELRRDIARWREERPDGDELPDDLATAQAAEKQAQAAEHEAGLAVQRSEAALKDLDAAHEKSAEGVAAGNATKEQRHKQLSQSESDLAALLKSTSDDDLSAQSKDARSKLDKETTDAGQAESRLQQAQPELVRLEDKTARKLVDDGRARSEELGQKVADLQGTVRTLGGEGLHDKINVAGTKTDRARRKASSTERRAAASKLLYDTFKRLRDEARARYRAPLEERITKLARIVYGPDYQVQLNDDLDIASRTRDHQTVAFKYLSTGTQEQLSLLARLACAQLVSEDGGVPLILDDVLGFSDPGRLSRMTALLSDHGDCGQTILLTADPARYRKVGGARIIDM